MTPGTLAILTKALYDIIHLPQPDEHECDDDQVIETLSNLINEE